MNLTPCGTQKMGVEIPILAPLADRLHGPQLFAGRRDYRQISKQWGEHLQQGFAELPDPVWNDLQFRQIVRWRATSIKAPER